MLDELFSFARKSNPRDLFIDFLGVFEVRRFVAVTVRVDGGHDARGYQKD